MDKPAATYQEDFYRFDWADIAVSATLERFVEERTDVRCELTVSSSHPTRGGQLYFGRLLLLGPGARRDVVNHLVRRDESIDWQGVLEQICTLALRRYREGEPAIDLWSADLGGVGRYLLRPFVFDDALNIVYGSGDSGKSLFCLAIALAVASGEEVAGMVAERTGPVLYLDWEDSPQTHQERLRGLASGTGVHLGEGAVIYRRMAASLKESAREIRKDIGRHRVAMVIVDSIGMACGGDPSDASAIIQTMVAARSFGVPVVGIHHISKDAKDKSNPYGSVYATNEARMSWFVEAERANNQLSSVLTNYKANRGARHERQAFRFTFTEDEREAIERIDVTSLTFGQSREVGDSGQKWKIAQFLVTGGPATVSAVAAAVEIPKATVRAILNRHKDLFLKMGENWASVTAADVVTPPVSPSLRDGYELPPDSKRGETGGVTPSVTTKPGVTPSHPGPLGAGAGDAGSKQPEGETPPWFHLEAEANDSLAGI